MIALSKKLCMIDDWKKQCDENTGNTALNKEEFYEIMWRVYPQHKKDWALYYTFVYLCGEESQTNFVKFHLEKSETCKSSMSSMAYEKQKKVLKQLGDGSPKNARGVYELMSQLDKYVMEIWGF